MPFWLKPPGLPNLWICKFPWPWFAMWPPAGTLDVSGVLQFYSVPGNLWAAFCSARGDPGEDLRLVASVPPVVVAQILLAATLPGGRRFTPMEATQVGMVYRACHRLVYHQAGGQEGGWIDPDPWAMSTASPGSMLVGGAPSSTGGALHSPERKMKLSQVADQGDESEFIVEAETNKGRYYATYMAKVGGLPADLQDPSIEQLSALTRKLGLKQPPYVDFAVFVPFAKKHLKAQRYQSFVMQEDGSFLAKMVAGPACFDHWQACFRVLRTALIMVEAINLANLMEWEAMVEKLNRQYPGCWGLIAAAEDRGRGEYMSKTLVKMKLEIDGGASPPAGWDVDNPWNAVWARVLRDKEYWSEQVLVPALTWTARG